MKRSRFKTAPEAFTHPEPSQSALQMQEALLADLFDEMVAGVADGRGVDEIVVKGWIDFGPMTPDEALEKGLVDALAYPDELDDVLQTVHGGRVSADRLLELPQPRSPWEDPKQIAVLYVEGGITRGDSSPGGLLSARTTGARTLARKLRKYDGAVVGQFTDSEHGASRRVTIKDYFSPISIRRPEMAPSRP